MDFYSTKNANHRVSLREAVLKGLPPDNGLYMPVRIPVLGDEFWSKFRSLTFSELAIEVAKTLLQGAIPSADLEKIVSQAVTFDAPLIALGENLKVLELFHGPTLAFKDFGARFMAQLMSYFVAGDNEPLRILVATSGDTGGAVAAGFFDVPGIEVVILYPSGKVSPLQEKQLTTWGKNIRAIEIDGTFDDCQTLVKRAFLNEDLQAALRLSSANSINIARLIPQSFYYFRAWQQLPEKQPPHVAIVPSGNFGNLTAGMIARQMGLPIHHMLAATNANDVVPAYLDSGTFSPRSSTQTISNAMDVGNPSNFPRMQALTAFDWAKMKTVVSGAGFSDVATREAILEIKETYGYLMDPHGAVGYLAWKKFQQENPGLGGIILETAHPAKFAEVMNPVIGQEISIPDRLAKFAVREKVVVHMQADFATFKSWLLEN